MSNFSEQDIRAIVDDQILKRFGGVKQNIDKDIEYLPTEEAYIKLGYNSPQQLRKQVRNGTLRLSTTTKAYEVQDRRSEGATYPRYFFNIQACIKRFNTAAEKRTRAEGRRQ